MRIAKGLFPSFLIPGGTGVQFSELLNRLPPKKTGPLTLLSAYSIRLPAKIFGVFLYLFLRSQIVTLKIATRHQLAESNSFQGTVHYFFLQLSLAPWAQPHTFPPNHYPASHGTLNVNITAKRLPKRFLRMNIRNHTSTESNV
jgi:hypothetical protein